MTAFEVIRMWVVSHEVKSVVYVPLLRQGELVHLLYLENNLIENAFTPERMTILHTQK